MAAKVGPSLSAMIGAGQHTSGIFSDMTVDGPEIGTLVAIVDRAKNLPNRKTMGKQNPYCAARLGKEAKKTDTDLRGGQTPKWDQELRFTVHDSLDYHNLKISVFSEDKRTDLVGEAWINLDNVITPGGGKRDVWQTLNCKGKYAGELRVELTYYDSRPKPERRATLEEDSKLRQSSSDRVKRRPLPSNPNSSRSSLTPDTIPHQSVPGRAKHGPRELSAPVRANSLPIEPASHPPPPQTQAHYVQNDTALPIPLHTEYEEKYADTRAYDNSYTQPEFLPALPPAPRQRQDARYGGMQSTSSAPRPLHLPHAHSDPVIPYQQDFYEEPEHHALYTAAPEPLHDLDYQHSYVQQRQRQGDAQWSHPQAQHYMQVQNHEPPLPPSHSRSTSALPTFPSPRDQRYETTSSRPVSRGQQQYISNVSPLQSIERTSYQGYDPQQLPPSRDSPYPEAPYHHESLVRQSQSPYRSTEHMSSISRQSPHPLSQEVPRARSPAPAMHQGSPAAYQVREGDGYHMELNKHSITPIVKPRAISPARDEPQWKRKNTYSIQSPIRAFESSDDSPLSRSRPQTSTHSTPRKSVSPHPNPPQQSFAGGVPFGPDSFDIHNPSVRNAADADGPYDQAYHDGSKRTITGWDGREIDPSDHLPVASWAPEPEVKTPSKTYGLGRERDFGPRSAESARLSKDTMVNVRRRGQSTDATPPTTIRARLVKKSAGNNPITPLSEHPNYNPVPDPYAQQEYSRGFTGGGPDPVAGQKSSYDSFGGSYGPPDLPPKVPLGYGQEYGQDALSREIASIDIGSAPRKAHSPIAYVPVRSHRDRNSFY